jgi:hypothetical protein
MKWAASENPRFGEHFQMKMLEGARLYWSFGNGHGYKPAAWANFSLAVLAVHRVRVPRLPTPSPPTRPARDGF